MILQIAVEAQTYAMIKLPHGLNKFVIGNILLALSALSFELDTVAINTIQVVLKHN